MTELSSHCPLKVKHHSKRSDIKWLWGHPYLHWHWP